MAKHYKTYGRKYLKVAFVFGCHLGLILLSVTGIYGLEKLFHSFWADAEPLLFDRFPLKYPLVLLFGYRGAIEINEILRG